MTQPLVTVACLAFHKPQETRHCLDSIRANLRVPHKTVLLDNGSCSDWAWDLFKEGLCDTLITKRESLGGGVGQTDLFRWVDTPYTLFVQQDQVLVHEINDGAFDWMLSKLANGYKAVDLAGDQGHGAWSDRAHLISTDFFNSLHPFPRGGPGVFHAERWVENYLQEVFRRPENKIFHVQEPLFFRDAGVWTVRQQPDGSRCRMRTDSKALWWETTPKEKYVFPEMSDAEWAASIAGEWPGGRIPEAYKAHSFNCWGDVKP